MDEDRKRLIDEVVLREWKMFGRGNNEGGRAYCQDDWDTFHIMREAQYSTWPLSLIGNYNIELMMAEENGRNLITEKYARMMASTVPERYREIEPYLPEVSRESRELAEEIISCHKVWMAEHAAKYPALAARGRNLYTEQDTEWETSSETYLRGELLTWPKYLLKQYLEFVRDCAAEGRNLVIEQDEYAVKAYGYASLEEAEKEYAG